jgi:hypothetical protein
VEHFQPFTTINYWQVRDSTGRVIAEFHEEADARAFVALPALIEACEFMLEWITDHHIDCSVEDDIRAALAAGRRPSPHG